MLALADSTSLGDLTQLAVDKKLPIDPTYVKQPLVLEKLQCVAMLKNLQAQTYYLFDSDHLDQTVKILSDTKNLPAPSILLYLPDDDFYLDDLNHLLDSYKKIANAPPAKTVRVVMNDNPDNDEIVTVQDFGSWLSGLWSDVKQAGQDALQGLQNFGQAVVDEAEVIGYDVASAFVGAIDPAKAQEFMAKSRVLQQKVSDEIAASIAAGESVIDDTAKVAKDVSYGAASIVGTVFDQLDPKLGSDIEGALDAYADQIIDYYADVSKATFAYAGGVVLLTVDAANSATTLIADSVIASKNGRLANTW